MDKLIGYGKECLFYYKKNIRVCLLMVLQAAVLFTFAGSILSLTDHLLYESDLMKKNFDGKVFYQLIDDYADGGAFAEFVNSEDSLGKLKRFYSGLSADETISYMTICSQPVETEDGVLEAVQIDQSFSDYYNLPIAEGRGFVNADFMPTGSTMPVLLGAEYQGKLKLGDTIAIYYHEREFEAVVIGFLKPYTSVYHLYSTEFYLDGKIIMPFKLWGQPETAQEERFQIIQYFAMINGYLVIGEDPEEGRAMMDKVETISERSGFKKYLFIGLSPFMVQYKWLLNVLQENVSLVYRISALALVLHTAMMGILVYMQQRKQVMIPVMQILFGCGLKEIFITKVLTFTGVIGSAFLLYLYVSEQFLHTGSVRAHVLLTALSIFMVLFYSGLSTALLWKNPPSTFLTRE